MPAKGLSKRRLKKQLRYAARGLAIGVIASLVLISGAFIIYRVDIGKHIGHGVPLGLGLLTTLLLILVYRLWRMEAKPSGRKRSVARAVVTELANDNKSKSA